MYQRWDAMVEVLHHHFISAAEEMRATLIRTAFSPVIYEVQDFGISIYDAGLNLIAEAPGLTRFLGANDYSICRVIEYIGPNSMTAGDIVISNYPYWNAAHISDATLTAPVFASNRERPFGYLCVRAHWADLGAKDPGYVLDSTDMHQEGLVFPGTHIFRSGQPVKEIYELIRFNSRTPDTVLGDLEGQVAAIRTGQKRIESILEKFGLENTDNGVKQILNHGERVATAALKELPEGNWLAEEILDDDGITSDPIPMRVRVSHRKGNFEIDLSDSPPCVAGPVNLPFGSTVATCKVAFKALTTPDFPSNSGHMRPLTVKATPGTLFHAEYPSPTYTQWTGIVLLELIYKAIAPVISDRLAACSGGDVPGFMMIGNHPDTGLNYAISNNEAVGWGATSEHDGANANNHPCQSIVRNTPIEVMESRTPMFFEKFELITDSGGKGMYRGGLGLQRDIQFLGDGEFITISKKTKSPPWALQGGEETTPTQYTLFPGTSRERRVGTSRTQVSIGDKVSIRTAGGGGFGKHEMRSALLSQEDYLDGFVSKIE